MHGCTYNLTCPAVLAEGLTAVERWSAARWSVGREWGTSWVLGAFIVLLLALAATLLALALLSKSRQLRANKAALQFADHAKRLGLNDEQKSILAHMASLAGLGEPEDIFTSKALFDRAVSMLLASQRVAAMQPQMRKRIQGMVEMMREKLGFRLLLAGEGQASVTTRQIPEGAPLTLLLPDEGEQTQAMVIANTRTELSVRPEGSLDASPGDVLLARYSNMGTMWEFETPLIHRQDRLLLLKHTGQIRFVNRRRFPRVPTRRPACLAFLPFVQAGGELQAPQFIPATVIEMAGPGLLLECSARPKLKERVALAFQLESDKTLHAIGRVRRVSGGDEPVSIAVELVDLNDQEMNELARATNAAAHEDVGKEEALAGAEARG